MRLLITAVVAGTPVDLAIEAEDDARILDLARSMTDLLGHLPVPAGQGSPRLRAVGRDDRIHGQPPPPLYLEDRPLDPDEPLAGGAVRHGAVVGVGAPAGRTSIEPRGLVEIRVVSGVGAGHIARLDPGDYTVGHGPGCDIRVDDADLPAVAATVRVRSDGAVLVIPEPGVARQKRPAPSRARPLEGPIVLELAQDQRTRRRGVHDRLFDNAVTVDPADDIPLLHLDRKPVEDTLQWPPGALLGIGRVLLELSEVTAPDASLSPNPAGGDLDYNRPPRLLPPQRATEFSLPHEPKRPESTSFPLVMMLVPVAMGLVMYLMTKSPYSLLIMGMSPLMLASSFTTNRRQAHRRYLAEVAEYEQRTARIQQAAYDALVEERNARRRNDADPAEILLTAVGPRARLWERRQVDPDFLAVRVGTADQPSEVRVTRPQREAHEGPLVWTASDIPVAVPLAQAGVTGIAGGPERFAIARSILGQLAVLQSPADLDLVLLADGSQTELWNWTRWLPHLRADLGDTEIAHVGADPESTDRRITELLRTLEERQAALRERDRRAAEPWQPILVVLDGARRYRLMPGMPALLQQGPSVRIFFLCLDEDPRMLPEECRAVVESRGTELVVRQTERAPVEGVRADLPDGRWAELLARTLAPIRDVSVVGKGGSVPASSRLLDVLDLDRPTGESMLRRWRSIGRTTEAVIGEGADGPFAIDLRRDGPHGLVAGTTGSGKSELLQTVIASLATNNRPDEMNFVLVDYKGGAAFKDCNRLPHTVGMVTDLDAHLTTRALESLGAELRRREHQLAAADAKDIEDYLAAKDPADPPMPRLLIVIDEFAALVAELPEFVSGLVDIARRGRSLGVHLILATQRPAGVVNAEIKSNTNLRIALRVTDASDSADVIEAADAAHIAKSTPGRGYARLGHSSLIAFQSARVGGRPRGDDSAAEVGLRRVSFDTMGTAAAARSLAEEDVSVPTDLASLVQAAQEAAALGGVTAPASPWLPALPDVVTLDEVLEQFPACTPDIERLVIPFGLTDVPSEQRRDVATFDIARGGHLAVISAPRAGRSTVLRAVAGAVGRFLSPEDVHMYAVDCGNNALLPLVGLPHVGAVVTRDQTDRMDRLVARLRSIISDRQQELALAGFADVTEQRAAVEPSRRLPYLLILFDRWEGFFQAYDAIDSGRLVQAWQQILQEGAAVGIRVVMTGDRTMLVGRMSTLLDDKLILRMTDPSDFGAVGMTARQVPVSMTEGRGFRAEKFRETQVAVLAADPAGTAQVAALQQIARTASERYADLPRGRRPFRLDVMPARIAWEEAKQLGDGPLAPTALVVGVGGDTLQLRALDALEHGPGLLVTGARRTGRSTVLRMMATSALTAGWNVVVVTPRLSPLRDLASYDGVYGPFDASSDEAEVVEVLKTVREAEAPSLTLVDDLELVGADGWLPAALEAHLNLIRDTGSVFAGAGTPSEMGSVYRGPIVALKRAGSGVMLSPQTTTDTDLFGARLPRSALGQMLPPGGGYLVRAGQAERMQVIWPE